MYQRHKNTIEDILSQCTHKNLSQARDCLDKFIGLYMTDEAICGAVEGQFGIYSLFFSLDPENFYMKCDCPSVRGICKHLVALGLNYLGDPESFVDIHGYCDALNDLDEERLIKTICSIFVKYPETYKIFEISYKKLRGTYRDFLLGEVG